MKLLVSILIYVLGVGGSMVCGEDAAPDQLSGSRLRFTPDKIYLGSFTPQKELNIHLKLQNCSDSWIDDLKYAISCGCSVLTSQSVRVGPGASVLLSLKIEVGSKRGLKTIDVAVQSSKVPGDCANAKISFFVCPENAIYVMDSEIQYEQTNSDAEKIALACGSFDALKSLAVSSNNAQAAPVSMGPSISIPEYQGLFGRKIIVHLKRGCDEDFQYLVKNENSSYLLKVVPQDVNWRIIPNTLLFTRERVASVIMVRDVPNETYRVDSQYFRTEKTAAPNAGWRSITLYKVKSLPPGYRSSFLVWDSQKKRAIAKAEIYGE